MSLENTSFFLKPDFLSFVSMETAQDSETILSAFGYRYIECEYISIH